MKVIAIDPGYDRCGIAIIEKLQVGEVLLHSDCITTAKESPFIERLGDVIDSVQEAIGRYAPSEMAIEKLFFNKNQKTAMRVAEVRGALIELARSRNLPVHEYTPGQIKVAVTGDGASDKGRVARMAQLLLRIEAKQRKDDEYDAIAVGITHLAHRRS